jgi:membrane protein implicated in regulation of membrane protease activity
VRRLRKRRQKLPEEARPGHGDPSALIWILALIGVALPWIAAGLGIAGGLHLSRGHTTGGWLLAIGTAALLADYGIDFLLSRLTAKACDQPDLNRRAAQLIGRLLPVAEAIEGGRGKVAAGDTLWPAEGPDTPVGTSVSVTGSSGTSLLVARVPN